MVVSGTITASVVAHTAAGDEAVAGGSDAHVAQAAVAGPDHALMDRVAAGDKDAHRQLYERHASAILAFLISRTSDRQLSEDLLHDVMLAAWRSAGSFRGGSAVRTWLIAIAHNKACNVLRRSRREEPTDALERGIGASGEAASGEAASAGIGADIPLEERVDLAQAMSALPEDQRTALVLYFYNGLSVDDIASVVGVPAGTVKSRMSRGKAGLRQRLAGPEHDTRTEMVAAHAADHREVDDVR